MRSFSGVFLGGNLWPFPGKDHTSWLFSAETFAKHRLKNGLKLAKKGGFSFRSEGTEKLQRSLLGLV